MTIDVTDDPTLIHEMAMAGCTGVFVGFESLAGENLDDAHKKTPRPEDYARRVAILHDHGIQVNGSFVLGFDHDRARGLRANRCLDRGGPLGVRNVPHLDALSGNAIVPAVGVAGAALAQGLAALRHGTRRFSTQAHGTQGVGGGIFLVLPSSVFAPFDLASQACRLAGCAPLPGDVVSLQTVKPALASHDQAPAHGPDLASLGRVDAMAAFAVSPAVGPGKHRAGTSGQRCLRGSVSVFSPEWAKKKIRGTRFRPKIPAQLDCASSTGRVNAMAASVYQQRPITYRHEPFCNRRRQYRLHYRHIFNRNIILVHHQ